VRDDFVIQPVTLSEKYPMVKYGQFLTFLLDHPEIRQFTPWSDFSAKRNVDEWTKIAKIGKSSRVLDIGCGLGLFTMEIARQGHTVIAVDHVPVFIDVGRKLSGEAGLEISWAVDRFPCDVGQGFDLICAINCFELWDHPNDIVNGIKQCLKPRGIAIVGWTAISNRVTIKHRAGPWLLQADKVIDTRTGKGLRFDWTGPHKLEDLYQTVGDAFRQSGFSVSQTNSWLIAKPID